MRTTIDIEKSLPRELLHSYWEQLSAVGEYVDGLSEEAALNQLTLVIEGGFRSNFGLTEGAASILARLATRLPSLNPNKSQLRAALERCALQRALVIGGYASELHSTYMNVARAAIAAQGLPADQILIMEPGYQRAQIPTLPPLHSQDSSIDGAGHSSLFATG